MLSLLLRSRLYRSFPQLHLLPAPELNPWFSTPCAHTVRVSTSTLGKRTLATSTEKTRKIGPQISPSYRLRTLRPENLSIAGQEVIDLSGKTTSLVPTLFGHRLKCGYDEDYPGGRIIRYARYPENTRGFFYYHNPPDGSEFYAGVRFRICDSAAEFEHGRDLLDPKGDVWGFKILDLVKHKEQEGFLSLLRAGKLIDEGLINDVDKLDITRNAGTYHYYLSEPFYLKVTQSKQRLTYVTRAKLVRLYFPQKVFTVQTGRTDLHPLTGSINVQFELSNLPEHEELGPTLVIRVLDVVEPITVDPLYDGKTIPPVPVLGTLLYRNTKRRTPCVLHIPLKRQPMADDLLELMKISWA